MLLNHHIINSGQRTGILFLHGFLGNSEEFRHIGRDFEKTHTVIYADLPGHGKSLICESDTIEEIAKRFGRLLEDQETRNWHVVGYSMGGRLALLLACQYPALIKRLTLISASPGIENPREKIKRAQADRILSRQIRMIPTWSFLSLWYRQPMFESFSQSSGFWKTLKRRKFCDPGQIALALNVMGVGGQPSLWHLVSKLPMAIELICGEKDQKFCEIAVAMKERNSAIRVTLVAKVGHVVHLEAGGLVKERLRNGYCRMESCESV